MMKWRFQIRHQRASELLGLWAETWTDFQKVRLASLKHSASLWELQSLRLLRISQDKDGQTKETDIRFWSLSVLLKPSDGVVLSPTWRLWALVLFSRSSSGFQLCVSWSPPLPEFFCSFSGESCGTFKEESSLKVEMILILRALSPPLPAVASLQSSQWSSGCCVSMVTGLLSLSEPPCANSAADLSSISQPCKVTRRLGPRVRRGGWTAGDN